MEGRYATHRSKFNPNRFRIGETTELRGAMKFLSRAMANMASDFFFLSVSTSFSLHRTPREFINVFQHYDLCSFLRERCRDVNVQFRFGFTARRVEAGENGPAVLFSASGERLEGDVVSIVDHRRTLLMHSPQIVGADGHNSIVRDFVLQSAGDSDDGSNTPTGPAVRQVFGRVSF